MVGSGGASGSSSGGWWWWWWQWRWWGHTRTFAHRRVAALHAYAIVQVGPNLQSEGVAAVPSQPGSAALSGTAPVGPHGGAGRGGGGGLSLVDHLLHVREFAHIDDRLACIVVPLAAALLALRAGRDGRVGRRAARRAGRTVAPLPAVCAARRRHTVTT